jgi:N-acyl amino acid synthase of PEP-CTERM/exosortase system
MKKLRKLADKPVIGPIVKKAMNYAANREVKSVASHFSSYLKPTLADNTDLITTSYNIRHGVYCEELSFEPPNPDRIEKDDFDDHSIICLIQHIPTSNYAGTVRIVTPQEANEQIPIQKFCLDSITAGKINPNDFMPHEICEISRLAVPAEFRRRQSDKFKGAATGGISKNNSDQLKDTMTNAVNRQVFSDEELRCFPFIAIGLYLSAASAVIENGIKHTFVMMEPRLARSMSFVGIKFEQIGPTVDYHGQRAPYYINPSLLMKSLSPGFKLMLTNIRKALNHSKNIDS